MSFNIAEHPFYKGIKLFESGQFAESFPLFLQVAQQGNLCALYYLAYLQEKHSDSIKEMKEADEFLRSLPEYIENMPARVDVTRTYNPKAWLQASLAILAFNKENQKSKKGKGRDSALAHVQSLAADAPNAAVFWYEQAELAKPTTKKDKMPAHMATLFKTTDLLALDKISNMPADHKLFISVVEDIDKMVTGLTQELAYIQKYPQLLAGLPESNGAREYFLGCYHMKKIRTAPAQKENFSEQRANGWHVRGAYFGDPTMQDDFANRTSIPRDAPKWRNVLARRNSFIHLYTSMQMLFEGKVGKRDLAKAKAYAERIVAHKDSQHASHAVMLGRAYDCLGDFYYSVKSYQQALGYYLKCIDIMVSKDADCGFAQFRVGEIYFFGRDDIAKDQQKALHYYKLASEKHPEAKGRYWYFSFLNYKDKFLKADSPKETLPNLLDAAKKGSETAGLAIICWYFQKKLPEPYLSSIAPEMIDKYLKLAIQYRDSEVYADVILYAGIFYTKHAKSLEEYQDGINYLLQSTSNSALSLARRAVAAILLGECYRDGYVALKRAPDLVQAQRFYKFAADLKDPEGLSFYGNFLLCYSENLKCDITIVINYLENALRGGALKAAFYLNTIYRFGKGGIDINLEKAFSYLRQAEHSNEEMILGELVSCYWYGTGVACSHEKAFDYCQRILDTGWTLSTAHRYLVKTYHCERKGYMDDNDYKEFCEILRQHEVDDSFSAYYYSLYNLLLDSSTENIQQSILQLEKSLQARFDQSITDLLCFLKERVALSEHPYIAGSPALLQKEIFAFIKFANALNILRECYKDFKSAIKAPVETQDKKERGENNELAPLKDAEPVLPTSPPKPPTPTTETAKPVIVPKATVSKPVAKADNAQKDREELEGFVSWFTDTRNTRNIDLNTFDKLVGKIAKHSGIPCEYKDTKKGFMYQVRSEAISGAGLGQETADRSSVSASQPLTFSTHREHGPKKKDPNVNRQMQTFVQEFAGLAALTDMKKPSL